MAKKHGKVQSLRYGMNKSTCNFGGHENPLIIPKNVVTEELLTLECRPIRVLLFAFEVCNVPKSVSQSLDFAANRYFIKLYRKMTYL